MILLSTSFAVSKANAQSSPYGDIAVSFASVDNLQEPGFRFLIALENQGDEALPPSGWELYFSMMRMLDTAQVPAVVRVEHINGGFYRITPNTEFRALEPGGRLVLPLVGDAMAIKHGDAPRGFYFVVNDERIPLGEVDVAPFVHDAQTLRSAEDRLPVPTPASRYESDAVLSVLDGDAVTPITPTPVQYDPLEGTWALDARTVVEYEAGLEREARFLVDALEAAIGARPETVEGGGHTGGIALRVDEDLGGESYTLVVEPERGVGIVGGDAAGVFYGIQSLRALLPVAAYRAPRPRIELRAVRVQDEPGFGYRGMMLDVSRNFQPAESVRRLLDVMSLYKLNHLHFHLTDDDGWRLEIDGLPELTAVGGRRGHTLDEREHLIPSFGSGPFPDELPGSGFYTREEYMDLLRYAAERHITVIPEIDVPGHARAAIVAMEARYHNLSEQGDEQAAGEFRLNDPHESSTYR
ncbi:MAG: family 20 glycosylhydrolase, partial [Longimicrobiales bacterium]